MSSEQLNNTNNIETPNIENLIDSNPAKSKSTGRVDINHLMLKVREEEKKAKKENLVFFGLVGSIIFVLGIILSF
jgi:hypothetical protein|tara:strand:- start:96 stop:320 length:225 start_codon:yes stop_codon:yes gene_type:complete